MDDLVTRYLELGLALGRHIDGMVDAFYGPPELAERVAAAPPTPPAQLADDACRLLADLESGTGTDELDAIRRHWVAAQSRQLYYKKITLYFTSHVRTLQRKPGCSEKLKQRGVCLT